MHSSYDEVLRHVDYYIKGHEVLSDYELRVHHPSLCADQPVCCIHKPSLHPMVSWPRLWHSGWQFMYRVCRHGEAHPDPDQVWHSQHVGSSIQDHVCDGCCDYESPLLKPFDLF